ncbi:MAG: hypothetical protein WAM01_14625 [Candidatus Acidiferrales bacterium]
MTRAERELAILQALCAGHVAKDERSRAMQQLAPYEWSVGEHRVVFDALGRVGADAGRDPGSEQARRARMAIATTRAGFPEVAWADYFTEDVRTTGVVLMSLIRALDAADDDPVMLD